LEVTGIVIVLGSLHIIFAIATLAWIALFVTTILLYSRYKLKYDAKETAINSAVSGRLADTIANNISIKLNANLKNEVHAFKELTQSQAKIQQFLRLLNEVVDTLQSGFMVVLEVAMLLLVFYFWRKNVASLGDFILIQAYVINLTGRLWDFGRVTRHMYEGFAYCNEMTEILTMRYEVRDRIGAKPLVISDGKISFKKVDFNYNSTRSVLRKLSLDIRAGEKLGVVGHSGAGKSTLVSLLLRYYDLTGGDILIDDQNIAEVTQDSLRKSISLIPQDVMLFHRTIAENIRYGKWDATDEEVRAAAKLAYCDAFIEALPNQYETLVGERGVRLSGGERQRIAIARAILKNAPILILDEATSSLDSGSEAAIQKSLAHLMKGKTTIVIAHRLSTLKQMDRIVVIEDGHVQEEGTHDELIKKKNGRYAELWNLQVGGFITE
jgi:ATP-binding cassette subfamily B protein